MLPGWILLPPQRHIKDTELVSVSFMCLCSFDAMSSTTRDDGATGSP